MKNIIFDLGNVLVTFRPDDFLHDLFDDEKVIKACKEVYFSDLWNAYDRGIYTAKQMVSFGIRLYPQYSRQLKDMMEKWVTYVRPIDTMMDRIDSLKEKGYDLYILSNLPEDCYKYLMKHYAFMNAMKGVFSFQEKRIKPDVRIYQILFDRYQLDPEDCLFIDDTKENVDQARKLGCEVIWCQSTDDLARRLERV